MLTYKQKKLIEKICFKPDEILTGCECDIVMVYHATACAQEAGFKFLFESGFDPEGVAEAFDAIGHKKAASTVRLTYQVFRSDPEDPALKTLSDAFRLMEETIETRLAEYLKTNSMISL